MAVVGIDLGTTCSVVGTPLVFEGEFFEKVKGVTIIKDDNKQRIHPSVLALDRRGNTLVGRRAKARAGLKPEPAFFAKRFMGQEKDFVLGELSLTPEQVSGEVLRHLKNLAEKKMGQLVDEAVITVPAYFSTLQKQKTTEAGEIAGLRVGKILQEPVAAAISYCHGDERDPLTIMTYDLGGGTFDVAVVTKRDGVFDIRSFDGDRYLGGCDFDKRLAFRIIDALKEQDFQVDIVPGTPEWHKMMYFAEILKTRLSDQEVYNMIEQNTGIIDKDGEPVTIDIEVTREEFEKMIREDVEKTIACCRRAVDKVSPAISYGDIDEIVMVGGSSRIPMIARRLEEEFNIKPKLSDPELSVAVGATIMAQRLSRHIGPLQLDYLAETTDREAVQVTGMLHECSELVEVKDCAVILTTLDNSHSSGQTPSGSLRQTVTASGGFLFPDVPLEKETVNNFEIRVEDPEGREVVTHRFHIHQQADGETGPGLDGLETNILAKPISIMTVSGLHPVAAERTSLPYQCSVPAKTMDQSGEVRVPVYEDNAPIGEIVVNGVPVDLPVGTRVDVSLTLREDFFIEGKAVIPKANVEGSTTIRIPLEKISDIGPLQDEYFKLKQKTDEALAQADKGQAFRIAPRLKAALEESREILYKDRAPNLAKAQDLLAEVETLIRQLGGWQPQPSPAQFEQLKQEIENEVLPSLVNLNPAVNDLGYMEQLKAIGKMADKALKEKNEHQWTDANHRLEDLHNRLMEAMEKARAKKQEKTASGGASGDDESQKQDPRTIKLKLGLDLTHLREEARRRERYDELEDDFEACDKELKKIDVESPNALAFLYDYYQNKHQPLMARVLERKAGKTSLPKGFIEALKDGGAGKPAGDAGT